ncbi:Lrp/AsnC family transcriptional regulator [Nocardia aurantiaca]|uniref:Lrp/AsnC family transcriptional regulator n=1 Tax=Nocardia aurantiaca TaxID=2675850 RepID=UPI002E1EEC86
MNSIASDQDAEVSRLIAALQVNGRATAEELAAALRLSSTRVRRLLSALSAGGGLRVVAAPPSTAGAEVTVLRIRVLRGKLEPLTAALARQPQVHFIDVSRAGDEICAVVVAEPDHRDRFVLEQLPATSAVTAATAQTVLHGFADAWDWRLHALTETEATALRVAVQPADGYRLDDTDHRLLDSLRHDARTPAARLAHMIGIPESTARRRIHRLIAHGLLRTRVIVDPHLLGLHVDANLYLRVAPADLHTTGEALARHPAVHGAAATTGPTNLQIALWLRDLGELYRFLTVELARYPVTDVETVLIGRAVKRGDYPALRAPTPDTNYGSVAAE